MLSAAGGRVGGGAGRPGCGGERQRQTHEDDGRPPWQRGFHLTFVHVRSCGALPVRAGEVLVLGEDLGTWTMAQRVG
ncbi:hypothetical protein ACFY1B_50725 [Streptomyces mirabilis]|uniref:hypothetical protein n=1 Tax=Streptomyces mirabilis TaxID=68239 RepID=UPI003677102C